MVRPLNNVFNLFDDEGAFNGRMPCQRCSFLTTFGVSRLAPHCSYLSLDYCFKL